MSKTPFVFPAFETIRVQARLLTLDDAPAVQHHFSDPEVTRFMDIEPCGSEAEAREIIDFHICDSGCRWGLFLRGTDELIGTCGFHCWRPEPMSKAEAEIGYDLAQVYWGKGLMREVLQVMVPFGFESMHLHRIYAAIEPDNLRSIQLLKGLGFRAEARDGMQWLSVTSEAWPVRTG